MGPAVGLWGQGRGLRPGLPIPHSLLDQRGGALSWGQEEVGALKQGKPTGRVFNMGGIRRVLELGRGKSTSLFSLTSNSNLALPSIMNEGSDPQ